MDTSKAKMTKIPLGISMSITFLPFKRLSSLKFTRIVVETSASYLDPPPKWLLRFDDFSKGL